MTSCVFAFGEGSTYFMESPKTWHWSDLPLAIHNRFPKNGEKATGSKISHVHNLVFGANGSYMLAWQGKDGQNYAVNHGLPPTLAAWLSKKDNKGFLIRDVKNLKLSLGPNNNSWWVTDGKNYTWHNLPSQLNERIQKLKKKDGGWTSTPKMVVLGLGESYVLATERGGGSWNVKDHYPQLDAYLDKLVAASNGGMFNTVSYISLDVFDATHFVLAHTTGAYQTRAPTDWVPKIVEVLETLPVPQARPHQAQRGSSNGIGSILKLANVVLNGVAQAERGGGGGGGGYSGGGVDYTQANMDFTQSLQNQTWSSVDSAANWNVQ